MADNLDDPDGVSLQISNMVRDAIKPDITMFVHYKTIEENGKDIVAVDIQRGTDLPYYLAKKKGCGQKASMSGRVILRFLLRIRQSAV